MKLLKITAGLFLLVQVFHLALLQNSTESPGRIIDKSWLRDFHKTATKIENTASTEDESELDQGAFTTMSSNDDIDGTASGFMLGNTDEELKVLGQHRSENKTSNDLNIFTTILPLVAENGTTKQPEFPEATISPTTTTTDRTNTSQTNMTEAEEELHSTMTAENSTSLPEFSNNTEIRLTTLAPENNTTEESTTPDADQGLTNQTGSSNTTTVTTTAAPPINETSTTSSSPTDADKGLTNRTGSSDTTTVTTTAAPPMYETSTTSSSTTTTAVPNTPERANKTGKGASSSERGLESDTKKSNRTVTWAALLGMGLVVACVGLVVYIWKKKQNGFTHRKLVEEYPSEPVLRLDNSEPLDLNFGGAAYYNPGLQGDSIQMTNFP
ncbi:uncharacterized protein [Leuresthes tenuis]|uniref:uncharacterized protein n=1 Tax=Leuresthes tenuis TaxID=355514 RepID=UPI003B505E27